MVLSLSIFHGMDNRMIWQSVNPVKYLRRGDQPGNESVWKLMGPCRSGQSGGSV